MTIEQVKKTEESPVLHEGWKEGEGFVVLYYNDYVSLFNCRVTYLFEENKLVGGRYDFGKKDLDFGNISAYQTLKNNLKTKYGETVYDNIYWEDSLYVHEPGMWEKAVRLQHLIFQSAWESKTTNIYMGLVGFEEKVFLDIHYWSKKYKPKDKF